MPKRSEFKHPLEKEIYKAIGHRTIGLSNAYNTPLTDEEMLRYREWLNTLDKGNQENPTHDYDMQGYYKYIASKEATNAGKNGVHFDDMFKKPNHDTFSNNSIYASNYHGLSNLGNSIPVQRSPYEGGIWDNINGIDTYIPSEDVVNFHGNRGLARYMEAFEPNAILLNPYDKYNY